MPGTLRENLVYGSLSSEPDLDDRLAEAVSTAGLDRLIHAWGLAGTLDPIREPKLAAAIVEARRSVARSRRTGSTGSSIPSTSDATTTTPRSARTCLRQADRRYVRRRNLAAHPFVRAVLEADELTKPLAAVGLSVATSMIEIFAEIPDGHPLFERFSFFGRRPALLRGPGRAPDGTKRGPDGGTERLIGLALRYSESRHRLGLIDDRLRERLLAARGDFAKMPPSSLQPAIEFYDEPASARRRASRTTCCSGGSPPIRPAPRRPCTRSPAGSLPNAGSTRRCPGSVSKPGRPAERTSPERDRRHRPRPLPGPPSRRAGGERALDGLPGPAADALVARLRRALVGRGLVLATSAISQAMESVPFDAVIRFEQGVPRLEDRRARRPEPVPA